MPGTAPEPGHILVVDDSLTVRMVLQDALVAEGYRVTVMEDGESARSFLEESAEWPDLVLLDLVLPGMDGIGVLAWIRQHSPSAHVPVILLTSKGEVESRVHGLDQGADDYIAKPFANPELFARLRAQLRIKRLQEELADQNQALETANREKAHLLSELEAKNEQLQAMATTDFLTGVPNRASIEVFLVEELARARRFRHPLSVTMVDVDHFKHLNDTHGHPFGDRTLRELARHMVDTVRQVDRVGRYGGEEFLLVLPETPDSGARVLMEKLRKGVSRLAFPPEDITLTISIGIASWSGDGDSWEDMVARADQALYAAKHGGRNRVCCWQVDMEAEPQRG
ncbi:MAG: diguanylate cyclase [Nitrospirota bacterium]|nr:diguanylate cyclase [Nitrospirota bacterium]